MYSNIASYIIIINLCVMLKNIFKLFLLIFMLFYNNVPFYNQNVKWLKRKVQYRSLCSMKCNKKYKNIK